MKAWAIDQAVEDLRYLGIRWDGQPFVQTQRAQRHQEVLQTLVAAGHAYPCTCTRKDIAESGSAPHFDHEPAVYPGTCADWRVGDRIPEAGTFAWRFRMPTGTMTWEDEVLGRQSCEPALGLGDFPITQKNGLPSYQLAVVIDDLDAGINQIVRGDDLLASTFRQLAILAAIGHAAIGDAGRPAESRTREFLPPSYAHVPLVIGPDGRRLAKRHGDTRLSTLRDRGIRGIEIVRWAAKVSGLRVGDHIDDALAGFAWEKLPRHSVAAPEDTLG